MNPSLFTIALFIGICQLIPGHTSEENEQDSYLKQFYEKYCSEKDIKVLQKLSKCEEGNPKEIKEMEGSCYKKIHSEQGKSGEITLQDYQNMECDPDLVFKFESCMNETWTDEKSKLLEKNYPGTKLDDMAKQIMVG